MKTIEERLFDRCVITEDDCWLFTGASCVSGYGRIFYQGALWLTHRVSWVLHKGPIPPKMLVCHKCDEPACCNPEHLFLGTDQDNKDDQIKKGRGTRGSALGKDVLIEDDVIQIRKLLAEGIKGSVIAERFNVARTTISKIKYGHRWAWLTEEDADE